MNILSIKQITRIKWLCKVEIYACSSWAFVLWLSSNQMAVLFDRDEKTIRKHINNIFSEEELEFDNNTQFLRVDGVKQRVAFYTLDVIISVGYRVKSVNGTRFRQWANKILKEYLIKGYAINKDLKIERYNELKEVVRLMARTVSLQSTVTGDERTNKNKPRNLIPRLQGLPDLT